MNQDNFDRLILEHLSLKSKKLNEKIREEEARLMRLEEEMERERYKNLSFSEALEYLKQGKKVKRKHWGGYWVMEYITYYPNDEMTSIDHMMIVAYLKDGGIAPAAPYQGDLLANDWECVE